MVATTLNVLFYHGRLLPRIAGYHNGGIAFVAMLIWLLRIAMPTSADSTLGEATAWLVQNLPGLTVSEDGMNNVTHLVTPFRAESGHPSDGPNLPAGQSVSG